MKVKPSEKDFKYLTDFANKHKINFATGTCGFGRPCVGMLDQEKSQYIYYNPLRQPDYEPIPEFESEAHYKIVPEDAYHKTECMAVLVHNDDYAEGCHQLKQWCESLEKIGFTIERYETGATGIQAQITGRVAWAIKLKQ